MPLGVDRLAAQDTNWPPARHHFGRMLRQRAHLLTRSPKSNIVDGLGRFLLGHFICHDHEEVVLLVKTQTKLTNVEQWLHRLFQGGVVRADRFGLGGSSGEPFQHLLNPNAERRDLLFLRLQCDEKCALSGLKIEDAVSGSPIAPVITA